MNGYSIVCNIYRSFCKTVNTTWYKSLKEKFLLPCFKAFKYEISFQSENMEHIRGIGFDYNNLPGLYGWEF